MNYFKYDSSAWQRSKCHRDKASHCRQTEAGRANAARFRVTQREGDQRDTGVEAHTYQGGKGTSFSDLSLNRKEQEDSKSHLLRAAVDGPRGRPKSKDKRSGKPLGSERKPLSDPTPPLTWGAKHRNSDSNLLEGVERGGLRDPDNEDPGQLANYTAMYNKYTRP